MLFVAILLAAVAPYFRYGALLLTYKVERTIFGDEGEAEALALMGRLGGSLERKYLLQSLKKELTSGANDQVVEGFIQGLINIGRREDIKVLGNYAVEALSEPKKAYIALIMIYGIQELGEIRFSEDVPSPVVMKGYDKFGMGMAKEKVTFDHKERFTKLVRSFNNWWLTQME
jgi:hypothetical protein